MEIFKYNSKSIKWYRKINCFKLLIKVFISFILFFLFFYYVGGSNNIDRALLTTSIVSFLIALSSILTDIIDNRERVFLFDDKKIGYIEIHQDLSGKYLRNCDFNNLINKEDIKNIYMKNHLYEGIDKGEINKIIKIKKNSNQIKIIANVSSKEWKSTSKFFISNYYIIDREYKKKIIIPNDYDNYNKLYKIFKDMEEKKC